MKLSFIGCGNMAKAIISGILAKGLVDADDIYSTNSTLESAVETQRKLGIQTSCNNAAMASEGNIIFLGVKPYQYQAVIEEIRDSIDEDDIVISIAPGKTIAWLEACFDKPVKIVRAMPNTPALVGEGMTSFAENELVTNEEVTLVDTLLSSFGKTAHVPEAYIDAASAVGGSAPAYVYMFIEALADGGVAEGLPRKEAMRIAAQTVLGSAKMVLESGKHPGQLKDEVCSPGGSTIKGLEALEQGAFRGTTIDAIRTCTAAARNL